jgi:hypothetical protein
MLNSTQTCLLDFFDRGPDNFKDRIEKRIWYPAALLFPGREGQERGKRGERNRGGGEGEGGEEFTFLFNLL